MRQSDCINLKPAINLKHAIRNAKNLGLPLTHFVTINFTLTHGGPGIASSAFEKLRDNYFNKWVRRPSRLSGLSPSAPAYAWVFENPDDVLNLHWIVHVPNGRQLDFEGKLPAWLERVTGGAFTDKALHVRLVDDPGLAALYMLKGADARYAELCRFRHEPQGWFIGNRSGISRSLNRTARKRAGIKAGRFVPLWKIRLERQQAGQTPTAAL